MQTSINFAADSLANGGQIKQRSQSPKQSETLPFTVYSTSKAQELTKATTSEFITADTQINPRS